MLKAQSMVVAVILFILINIDLSIAKGGRGGGGGRGSRGGYRGYGGSSYGGGGGFFLGFFTMAMILKLMLKK